MKYLSGFNVKRITYHAFRWGNVLTKKPKNNVKWKEINIKDDLPNEQNSIF